MHPVISSKRHVGKAQGETFMGFRKIAGPEHDVPKDKVTPKVRIRLIKVRRVMHPMQLWAREDPVEKPEPKIDIRVLNLTVERGEHTREQ